MISQTLPGNLTYRECLTEEQEGYDRIYIDDDSHKNECHEQLQHEAQRDSDHQYHRGTTTCCQDMSMHV